MATTTILFLLLIAELISVSTSQPNITNRISLGSSLNPGSNKSYWLSNSGQFAFGFYQQSNGGFSVGVWFQNTKNKTVAWTARRDDPLLSGEAKLILNYNGRLVLQDARGLETIISQNSKPAAFASMLDSGNFVLCDSNSTYLWQSFDSPTDTLLPDQPLLTGNGLVSGVSATNLSSGRFQLFMQLDGNLVQYPWSKGASLSSYHAYWNTQTYGKGLGVSLNLDHNGRLFLRNSTGFNILNISAVGDKKQMDENVVYRLTLDADGMLRLYELSLDQNNNWEFEWSPNSNECDPIGLCGVNSYCELVNQAAQCFCLPGFDFVDRNQKSLGCGRNSSFDACNARNEGATVEAFDGFQWENNSYSAVSTSSKADCEDECLKDCNCEIALFMDGQCQKQKFPVRFSKPATDRPATTIVVKRTTNARGKTGQRSNAWLAIVGAAISGFGLFSLAISVALIFRFRMWEYRKIDNQSEEFLEDVIIRAYKYAELERATYGFKDRVGSGAFGTVFRGVIVSETGRKIVAVKRLERTISDGEGQFRNEMKAIGKTHHRNLVRLLGYCQEGTNRLLVYEYMPNGSLSDFLFKSEAKPEWEVRTRIILQIARGILYLHEECETQIIHCDIKPENILMDESNNAKIADFGLAKLLMPDQTRTYTGLRGTRGYVAPEWHRNMPITAKADVYSFGVVLMEVVCCRRSVDMDVPEDKVVLANWVFDCFLNDEFDELVGDDEEVDKGDLKKMIKLGLWCIQEEPSLRPSMKKVCLMLEGTVEIPGPPNPMSSISVVQID